MATRKKVESPEPGTTSSVAPSLLRLYKRNPRKGNVGAVAASLQAHGQYRPIVVNIGTHTGRANEVLAGNHTLKAIRQLAQRDADDPRWSSVLVHWIDVDEDQAKRVVLADNKTSEGGSYDHATLADLLTDLNDSIDGFGGTGFTFEDFDAMGQDPLESLVDAESLVDEDDLPPETGGRGAPVVSYSIVFDSLADKAKWVDFMNWLKRTQPECTVGERITNYIEDQAERAAEFGVEAETEEL